MPDLWMDVDTALSEVPINKTALIDDTDFKTREESVVYNQAGLDLVWNFVTTAGVFTQTAVTPTESAGNYDWSNQGNGQYAIEIPASGGASINNDTEGFGWFSGVATGILPWTGPVIGFRAAALNDAYIDGGDVPDVNVTQFGGTSGTFSGGRPEVNTTLIEGSDATDQINAACDAAIETYKLDHLVAVADADDPVNDSIIAKLASATGDWSTFVASTDSLEASQVEHDATQSAIAALNDPTAADIADAVWDEATSGHTTTGTFGEQTKTDIDSILTATRSASGAVGAGATASSIPTNLTDQDSAFDEQMLKITSGALAGEARPILTYANAGGTFTMQEPFSDAPANGVGFVVLPQHVHPMTEIADTIWDEATSGHSTAGTYGKAVSDILADTNELQTDWANGGRLDLILDARASQSSVDTIDDLIDTEIAAIIASIATVDANVDAILLDTGTDGVPLTAAAIDAIHDEPITEPSGRPAWASMTHRKIQQTLAVLMLNEVNSDSNSVDVRNDADDTTLWSYPSSDDGSIYTSGKAA